MSVITTHELADELVGRILNIKEIQELPLKGEEVAKVCISTDHDEISVYLDDGKKHSIFTFMTKDI